MSDLQEPFITDEMLSAYIDSAVTDEQRKRIESAIATDTEIAWRLESLTHTVQLLRAMPEIAAPRSFALTATMDGMQILNQRRDGNSWLARLRHSWLDFWQSGSVPLRNTATACLAIFVILLGVDGSTQAKQEFVRSESVAAVSNERLLLASESARLEAQISTVDPISLAQSTQTISKPSSSALAPMVSTVDGKDSAAADVNSRATVAVVAFQSSGGSGRGTQGDLQTEQALAPAHNSASANALNVAAAELVQPLPFNQSGMRSGNDIDSASTTEENSEHVFRTEDNRPDTETGLDDTVSVQVEEGSDSRQSLESATVASTMINTASAQERLKRPSTEESLGVDTGQQLSASVATSASLILPTLVGEQDSRLSQLFMGRFASAVSLLRLLQTIAGLLTVTFGLLWWRSRPQLAPL